MYYFLAWITLASCSILCRLDPRRNLRSSSFCPGPSSLLNPRLVCSVLRHQQGGRERAQAGNILDIKEGQILGVREVLSTPTWLMGSSLSPVNQKTKHLSSRWPDRWAWTTSRDFDTFCLFVLIFPSKLMSYWHNQWVWNLVTSPWDFVCLG